MRRIGILLLMILLTASNLLAAPALEDVVKALELPFSQASPEHVRIKSFAAAFIQQSHVASIDRVQHGQGDVQFKFRYNDQQQQPKALFRWLYSVPQVQEILSDGEKMWVYVPENRQVIESDLTDVAQQGGNPISFLSGLGNLSRDFTISWGAPQVDEQGNYHLQLQPRQPSSMLAELEVVVRSEALIPFAETQGKIVFPLLQTLVTDSQGNRTTIEFSKVKVNSVFADSLFHFDKPEDVEVVRPGEDLAF